MGKQTEYQRELYKNRKENNLCLWCGKPLDRDGTICVACANKSKERSKERRDYFLKRGLCPICGKRKLPEEYKACDICRTNISERKKERYANQAKHLSIYQKTRRQERIEKGLCTKCGKRPATPGFKTCEECRKERRKYDHIYVTKYQMADRALWKAQGRCARCGSYELYAGTLLCEKCYQISCEALVKARKVHMSNRARIRAEREAAIEQRSNELKIQFRPKTLWEQRINPRKKIKNSRRRKDKQGEQIR